ncbi:MAG: hypothetical protein GWM87_04160 [Xanthomonadales bacterium]|nr:hypothetical protein [Xanthomonadales bacterium]NIX12220.1 hypothetical protein [Xanthomonadales bacterium]
MAQDDGSDARPPIPLAELAAGSDLVALVQVLDTDYEYVRGFPSGGTAFLRVLIPYKVGRAQEDIIEVYDEGLYEHECYFENPPVGEEGRRYLVFLRFSEEVEDQYNGHGHGCKLPVLVSRSNRYVLRFPPKGIALSDDLEELAEPTDFADRHALVEEEDLSPAERDDLLARGLLEPAGERFRYTHGVELGSVRTLMGEKNLTRDRFLRRPVQASRQNP